jgi:hypothetical protein
MAPTGFLKSQHPRNGDVALDARLVEQDDQDKRERKNNDHNVSIASRSSLDEGFAICACISF